MPKILVTTHNIKKALVSEDFIIPVHSWGQLSKKGIHITNDMNLWVKLMKQNCAFIEYRSRIDQKKTE